MPFEDLSKSELISILELIEKAQKCKSPESVRSLIMSARDLFEAEFAVCGFTSTGLQPRVSHFVNGNYPEEWVRRYTEENRSLHDPVVRFHSRYMLTQLWSEVFRSYQDPEAVRLVRDAGDYGLRFGVSGAVYAPERDEVAIFTFASDRDRFKRRHRRLLDILTIHFYRALNESFGATSGSGKENLGQSIPGLMSI